MDDVIPNLMNNWNLLLCWAFIETHHGASFTVNYETRFHPGQFGIGKDNYRTVFCLIVFKRNIVFRFDFNLN